jgi:hypothetical protein
MAKKQYVALIGDIVGSRQLKNRRKVQEELETCLSALNSYFSKHIKAKFVITIGDEFQGLVNREFPLHEFLVLFQEQFNSDFKTRFGVGLGTLSTKLKKEAFGMDGPCFHNAREAIETAKKQSKNLVFQGFELNQVLSSLFELVSTFEDNWTKRQAEIIQLYLKNNDQTKIAEVLKVSKQTISKAIHSAQYDVVQNGWNSIQELFSFSPGLNK